MQLQKFAMLVTDRARPVKREYEDLVEKTYDAFVEPVDFLEVDKTLRLVNGLVSNLTRGQITDTIMKDDLFKVRRSKVSSKSKIENFFLSGSTDPHHRALLPRQMDERVQHDVHQARAVL